MLHSVCVALLLYCCTHAAAAAAASHPLVERALHSARQARGSASLCHEDGERYERFVRREALQLVKGAEAGGGGDAVARRLFAWCSDDAECCADFYMRACNDEAARTETHDDFETFKYLARDILDNDEPLTALLDAGGYCGHSAKSALSSRTAVAATATATATATASESAGLEQMLRRAWVLEMRLNSYKNARVHCSEHEHFVYSPADAEGRCVCNAEQSDSCHVLRHNKRKTPWNYSMTAIITAGIAAVVYFVLRAISEAQRLSTYDAIRQMAKEQRERAPTPPAPPRSGGGGGGNENAAAQDLFLKMLHQKRN